MTKDLTQIRKEIDEIDRELLALLTRRMRVSEDVARYKIANGIKVSAPERERELLDAIAMNSPDDIKCSLVGVFDCIINMSKLRQYELVGQELKERDALSASVCGASNLVVEFSLSDKLNELSRIIALFGALGLRLVGVDTCQADGEAKSQRVRLWLEGNFKDERVGSVIAALGGDLADFKIIDKI